MVTIDPGPPPRGEVLRSRLGPRAAARQGTVAFLHVPKAGGTSYGSLLASLLRGRHWIPPIGDGMSPAEAHRRFDPQVAQGYALVAGHFDFGICEQAPSLRPVTVLRDPIDRLVSAYRYGMRRTNPFGWPEYFRKYRISLEDCLREDDLRAAVTTGAVPQLAGCLWSGRSSGSEGEVLARALHNLRSFVHVGIQERLSDSARLLVVDLGLATSRGVDLWRRRRPCLEHLNASCTPAPDVSDDLRALLEERLASEYVLYRAGRAQFEERFATSDLAEAS